jgi:hypothetical protein
MKEIALYPNIKQYFEALGYDVKAEVNHVDVMCVKDEEVILVELKLTLNETLIYQGIQRQKLYDHVYLAILKPSEKIRRSKSFQHKLEIVKHLSLGMLYVHAQNHQVEVIFHAHTATKKKPKHARKLVQEFHERKLNMNEGGSHQQGIMTAYKELTMHIVASLSQGAKSIQAIRLDVVHPKVSHVLQKNYHGYFERVQRGHYQLTPLGFEALARFEQLTS